MEEAAVEAIYFCTYAKQKKKKNNYMAAPWLHMLRRWRFMLLFLLLTYVTEEILQKEVLYISSGHVVNCWKNALLVLIKAIIESESTRHFASLQFRCQYWK